MKRKLGELLIEAGAATAADVELALSDQAAGEPSRLGELLLSNGKITPTGLAHALATQHNLPFADLSYVAPEASGLIPLEFQRAHRLVPFRLDKETGVDRVHVAIADPTLSEVVEELRSQLRRQVVVHVAAIDGIESVHQALAGEGGEVVVGEVLEEGVLLADLAAEADVTREVAFPGMGGPTTVEFAFTAPEGLGAVTAPFDLNAIAAAIGVPAVTAPPAAAPASVTAEDLFGSMDLGAATAVAPLSTDLADEIGRHDLAPPTQDFVGFSALAQPMGDGDDRFGARASSPALLPPPVPIQLVQEMPLVPGPLPSAPILEAEVIPAVVVITAPLISPLPELEPQAQESTQRFAGSFPVTEPTRIPSFAIAPDVPIEPMRRAATRAGLKKAAPPQDPLPPPVEAEAADLALPDWMRGGSDAAPAPVVPAADASEVSARLADLLVRVETGDLPVGPALAALMRLLVDRRVLDDAALTTLLDKL